MMVTSDQDTAGNPPPIDFELDAFFPYLVRRFYISVRDSVSEIYQEAYNLTVSEWRALSIIGPEESYSATEIVEKSSLDKVAVSRAVSSMRNKGYLTTSVDRGDRRRIRLKLSKKGREIYFELVPRMLALEQDLLAGFSPQDRKDFLAMMQRVRDNTGLAAAGG